MLRRVVITLSVKEFEALEALGNEFGYTVSQMAKHILLGELGLPPTNSTPIQTLKKELEDYVRGLKKGGTCYVTSAFGDRWWDFDTGTKRAMAWHLKSLEEKGLCKKTGKKRPNGTNQYCRT